MQENASFRGFKTSNEPSRQFFSPGTFAATCLVFLIAAAILPAFRLQLFGQDYAAYYSLRLLAFSAFALFIHVYARGFGASLQVGNAPSVQTGYGDPLLTLRAFACFIVLVGHGTVINYAPQDLIRQAQESRLFWLVMPLPWTGVWIFFTLSGYLMGKGFFSGRYSFDRVDLLRFYRNRAMRIVPLAYFAILVVVLFVNPQALAPQTWHHLMALLLFDYDGTSPVSVIGLLWSIATEMQFYLAAPFMAYAIWAASKRVNIVWIAVAMLAAGGAYRIGTLALGAKWYFTVYTPFLGNIDLFGAGMLAAFAVQKYEIRWGRLGFGFLAIALMYVTADYLCAKLFASPAAWSPFIVGVAPTIFATMTAFTIIAFEGAVRHSQPSRSSVRIVAGTQWLGTITYAVYLWHAPIFSAYARTLQQPLNSNRTIMAVVVSSALVLLFSWLTYLAIERPLERMKSRKAV